MINFVAFVQESLWIGPEAASIYLITDGAAVRIAKL